MIPSSPRFAAVVCDTFHEQGYTLLPDHPFLIQEILWILCYFIRRLFNITYSLKVISEEITIRLFLSLQCDQANRLCSSEQMSIHEIES
jgi:hypothetical protein